MTRSFMHGAIVPRRLLIAVGVAAWLLAGRSMAEEPAGDVPTSEEAAAAQREHFHRQVLPLLRTKCFRCHGPEEQEGELRLDSREWVLKGGENGAIVSFDEPERSPLIRAVRRDDPERKMPPDDEEKLSEEQIAALVRWIGDGVPWSSEFIAPLTDENPVVRAFGGQRLDLWSLQPVRRPDVPQVDDGGWAKTPVDNFTLARLHAAGLAPSPEADRRTLIRRLTFDLVGLPPTPEEVDAFVNDESPGAYDALVERLLASKHYGEQWGRHWLDVVRYSDTEGFERDEFRPTIYRYRDYVIRSFNADKPYDQFLREQLAGDELVAGRPIDEAAVDSLVATGFLRLGPRDTTAEIFEENERSRDQLLGDLANTTGEALLGLTMSCCQCHDHKYDPLLQVDHFRLRAFFAAVQQEDELPISTDSERAEIDRHNEGVEAELAPLRGQSDALLAGAKQKLRTEQKLADDAEVSDDDAKKALSDEERKELEELSGTIDEIEKRKRKYTTGWCAKDSGSEAPAVRVYFQGDTTQPRDEVPPGFLSILEPHPADIPPQSAGTTGRRTALAGWIVAPENPLTARVMVNRIWQHHFGRGIVATPNDFGYSGARPTHPELLDWLADEFVASGWSIKHVHRLMVKSATYRQASFGSRETASVADDLRSGERTPTIVDPENQLLWRQNPRRLDAEALRDAMLLVSGEMLPVDSGPPRWPAIPEFVRRSNPATLDDNGRLQNWYTTTPEEDTFVRTIFTIHKRTIPIPFLQPFDLPDSTRSCARRDVTIVAPQASTLMNSPFALAMAEAMAERVANEAGDDDAQVRAVFRLALVRQPDEEELAGGRALLARHVASYRDAGREHPEHDALIDLCRAVMNSNEFSYID